jgi:hypothetical protein
MNLEDTILVSIDDHMIEPPDMFERHVPQKWRDQASRVERSPRGHRSLDVPRHRDLHAVRHVRRGDVT